MVEHMDLLKAEVRAKCLELRHEMRDGEQRGIRDLRRIPAPELVVSNDLSAVSYRLERLEVNAGEAGTAMQQDDRITGPGPRDLVPDFAARNIEVALACGKSSGCRI